MEGLHPLAFSARINSDDTPRYHEAMSGPDAPGFIEAMKDEYGSLESMKAWTIVPRQKAVDEGKRYLIQFGLSREKDTQMDL